MNDKFEKIMKKLITEPRTHTNGGEEFVSITIASPTYGFLKDRKLSKGLKTIDAAIWGMVEEKKQLETRIKELEVKITMLEDDLKERTDGETDYRDIVKSYGDGGQILDISKKSENINPIQDLINELNKGAD